MGIAALPRLPDPALFKHRLYQEHRVEVPLMEWDGRAFLRISVQGYNTDDDIERLLAGLRTLLAEVA
jgi:isopenicillin-N epimerase